MGGNLKFNALMIAFVSKADSFANHGSTPEIVKYTTVAGCKIFPSHGIRVLAEYDKNPGDRVSALQGLVIACDETLQEEPHLKLSTELMATIRAFAAQTGTNLRIKGNESPRDVINGLMADLGICPKIAAAPQGKQGHDSAFGELNPRG